MRGWGWGPALQGLPVPSSVGPGGVRVRGPAPLGHWEEQGVRKGGSSLRGSGGHTSWVCPPGLSSPGRNLGFRR